MVVVVVVVVAVIKIVVCKNVVVSDLVVDVFEVVLAEDCTNLEKDYCLINEQYT